MDPSGTELGLAVFGVSSYTSRSYNAAGELDVCATAAAMRHCALFVAHDTKTMHIASTAGIPCVGIYSSRQWRGLWEPYTATKRILRSEIECEACGLTECIERDRECLRRIMPHMAVEACTEFLEPERKRIQSRSQPQG